MTSYWKIAAVGGLLLEIGGIHGFLKHPPEKNSEALIRRVRGTPYFLWRSFSEVRTSLGFGNGVWEHHDTGDLYVPYIRAHLDLSFILTQEYAN
jgi:hypothetical protein